MLAISKRYLLRPASRIVVRKRNSCVLGEQEATMTRLSLFVHHLLHLLLRILRTGEEVLVGKDHIRQVLAYAATSGTFTTPAMLTPQSQTKTPMRGSSFRHPFLRAVP